MKKLSQIILLFLFFPLAVSFADNEKILFIGNPGVGKSTLINGLVKEKVAGAGVKIGSGLTEFFHAYEVDNIHYLDTPGLSDIEMRERAAREIETALKQNGIYRIFFVITLEAGRVRPDDITTIELVMAAINNPQKTFNIIINKLNKQEKTALFSGITDKKDLYKKIALGQNKTKNIWYVDQDHALADGDKDLLDINNDLRSFIHTYSSFIEIKNDEIGIIKENEFEELKERYENQIKELNEQLQAEKNKPPQVIYQTVHHHDPDDGDGCVLQ